MRVAVLLPSFNEEESIGDMIDGVRAVGDYDIFVVDGGSTDKTVEIALKHKADVIRLDERGKGMAISKVFGLVDHDVVVMLDSDMSYAPDDIPNMIQGLECADVVLGSRFSGHIEDGAMSDVNRFGNHILTWLARTLYGVPVTDVCSGFWAFNRHAYGSEINVDARHFELEANLFVECALNGLVLKEVSIRYMRRRGKSKLDIGHGLEIASYLIRRRLPFLLRCLGCWRRSPSM